jgi:type IV secretion system protein VirB9
MIRGILLASVALLPLCGPAAALEEPRACPGGDARVRCVAASPSQVVLLRARPGASLVIELPDDERVLAVPVSDNTLMTRGRGEGAVRVASEEEGGGTVDGNLSVAVRGRAVVVKPHGPLAPQPFFVLTEREGKQHRYAFELRADAEGETPYYYSVRVRNIAAEQQAHRARAAKQQRAREQQVARDRLVQAQAAPCAAIANVNRRYAGRGDAALAPSEVCDDGRSTYLRFPGVQRRPAVFSILPDGREAAVNVSTGADGWVTVHQHSPMLRLRDGGRVLCLINRGYVAAGQNPGTGTVSPDVVRAAVAPPP